MQTRDDAYVPGGSATLAAMVALSAAVIVEGPVPPSPQMAQSPAAVRMLCPPRAILPL